MNKKFTSKKLLLTVAVLMAGQAGFAQISGNVTVGTGGTYPTLTGTGGLFEAINGSGLSGNVTASIISDITETGATTLAQWTETPASSNFTVTIAPGDGTEKLISGSVAGGLIGLAGADRVTFDGRFNGSGRYLRFRNTSTASAGSTFNFTNDAQFNTITYCNIEGAGGASGGDILIGASNLTAGNDNNTITNNIIGDPTSTLLPYYLIRVSSTNATVSNDNGMISGNEFLNWQGTATLAGNAIYLTGASNTTNNWTVQNNAIYQTGTRISALYGVFSDKGSNQTITNNKIGGGDNQMGGTAMRTSQVPAAQGITICGIYVVSTNTNTAGPGGPNTIANNQISNIQTTGTTSANKLVYGINVSGANNITNNTIGNTDSSSSIISNGGSVIGIFATALIGNNTLKNVIKGNSINNLIATFSTNKAVTGIFVGTPYGSTVTSGVGGVLQVDSNSINGLYGSNTAGSFAENSVVGITISSFSSSLSAGQSSITRNTITKIVNNASGAYQHGGIVTHNAVSAPLKIANNKISNIYSTGVGGNKIIGIGLNGGANATDSVINNVVSMGSNSPTNNSFYGIYDINSVTLTAGATKNFFNNTVLLSGNQDLSTTATSVAFFKTAGDIENLRNNIFINKRVGINTGAGTIYAMYNNATSGSIAWNSDYNLLSCSNPLTLVYWKNTTETYDFEGYQGISLKDTNAVTGNVTFANETGNDLHLNTGNADAWNVYGRGIALAPIGFDLDGNVRSITIGVPTTLGAYEIAMPSVLPADMIMTGAIAASGVTTFTSAGRKIAEITWGNNVPSSFTTAKYYPGVSAPNPTMTGPGLNSYFELNVTPDVSTYDYTIKTYYTQAEANGVADNSMTGIKKHAANPYVATDAGNTSTQDANGKYLTSNTLTDFSIFSMTGNATPLIINLANINAKNVENKSKIDWSTASEEKSDYFELERSLDSRNFSSLATIQAHGIASNYTYWDESPSNGLNYYRLKMMTERGTFVYSKIVVVAVNAVNGFGLKAFPNPVLNRVHLAIEGNVQDNAKVMITDITGKVLETLNVTGNNLDIDMGSFTGGLYFIKYIDNDHTATVKVSKQ